MIAFLTWWTAASIIVCSGISAIVVPTGWFGFWSDSFSNDV